VSGEEPQGGQPRLFSYHRSIAPMMWVFVALASVELLVVHFLISFWSGTAALIRPNVFISCASRSSSAGAR